MTISFIISAGLIKVLKSKGGTIDYFWIVYWIVTFMISF
jgi:hypothetical protein